MALTDSEVLAIASARNKRVKHGGTYILQCIVMSLIIAVVIVMSTFNLSLNGIASLVLLAIFLGTSFMVLVVSSSFSLLLMLSILIALMWIYMRYRALDLAGCMTMVFLMVVSAVSSYKYVSSANRELYCLHILMIGVISWYTFVKVT